MIEEIPGVAAPCRKIRGKACLHYQTKKQRNRNSDTGDAEEAGARHIQAVNLQDLKKEI